MLCFSFSLTSRCTDSDFALENVGIRAHFGAFAIPPNRRNDKEISS